jgi:4'-phosphopantetheinyl transferase
MAIYWFEQGQGDLPPSDDWLTADEALRLGAMRFEKRRADWRLGRWTAKLAVSAYCNVPCSTECLRRFEIRPETSGAPNVWIRKRPAPLTISLSHRDGAAVCAVAAAGIELGCDLETVEPRSPAFLADYFTSREQLLVEQAAIADRPRLVALLWSAKESALKALRLGLRLDTRRVEVTGADGWQSSNEANDWRPLRVTCESRCYDGWWREAGRLVRTVLAAPRVRQPPLALESWSA